MNDSIAHQLSLEDEARKLELLSGEALGDLSEQEAEELSLIRLGSDDDTVVELSQTAAAIQLASMTEGYEKMPESLSLRIRSQSERFVASRDSDLPSKLTPTPKATLAPASLPPDSAGGVRAREIVAWLACAAATMLLFFSYVGNSRPRQLSASAQRTALLAQGGSDLVVVNWAEGTTPFEQSVSGDVVWDNVSQTGFMKFVNLPINDATKLQYQLWIIDPERDDEPIDGGVFDSTSTGELIIPIDAKLPVIAPAAFAITVEKAGGVVVSTQENLPLLAAVE